MSKPISNIKRVSFLVEFLNRLAVPMALTTKIRSVRMLEKGALPLP